MNKRLPMAQCYESQVPKYYIEIGLPHYLEKSLVFREGENDLHEFKCTNLHLHVSRTRILALLLHEHKPGREWP